MKGKKEPMTTYFLTRTSSREIRDGENNTKIRVVIKNLDSKNRVRPRNS